MNESQRWLPGGKKEELLWFVLALGALQFVSDCRLFSCYLFVHIGRSEEEFLVLRKGNLMLFVCCL